MITVKIRGKVAGFWPKIRKSMCMCVLSAWPLKIWPFRTARLTYLDRQIKESRSRKSAERCVELTISDYKVVKNVVYCWKIYYLYFIWVLVCVFCIWNKYVTSNTCSFVYRRCPGSMSERDYSVQIKIQNNRRYISTSREIYFTFNRFQTTGK